MGCGGERGEVSEGELDGGERTEKGSSGKKK